jgi:hypothetical protein
MAKPLLNGSLSGNAAKEVREAEMKISTRRGGWK